MRIFYLGPEGTFTHQAALEYFQGRAQDLIPSANPKDVIEEVMNSGNSYGVVPIENSIHGEVIPTLDALVFGSEGVYVVGEISLPVSFGLYAKSDRMNIKQVISHPHALAQCRLYISRKGFEEKSANSTADACRIVSESTDTSIGAIASSKAAESYNLKPIDEKIEDFIGAETRFFIVASQIEKPIDEGRTLIAILPPSYGSGIISEMTGIFSEKDLNISMISTRPTKQTLGRYIFILGIDGDLTTIENRKSVFSLLSRGYRIKVLGTASDKSKTHLESPFPDVPGLMDSSEMEKLISDIDIK